MQKNNTLKELLIGIFAVGILAQILCLIFLKRHLYHALGLWVGILVAAGMAIQMKQSIEDGLDLAGDAGVKHMKKAYFVRTAVVCVVLAIVMYYRWGNPITILLGITALKIAVYLQPLTHKILDKEKKVG